jgi:hypothetical protein
VLGTGAGRLWANATSGKISLLRRPVDEEDGYHQPGDKEER